MLEALTMSGKSAMTRKRESVPARIFHTRLAPPYVRPYPNKLRGNVLDYGAGKGADYRYLKELGYIVTGYDRYFSEFATRPSQTFSVVLCTYVLNTLPIMHRRAVIEDVHGFLDERVDSFALFSVRDRGSIDTSRMEPYRDGYITSKNTFQKPFTPGELAQELIDWGFNSVQVIESRPVILLARGDYIPF